MYVVVFRGEEGWVRADLENETWQSCCAVGVCGAVDEGGGLVEGNEDRFFGAVVDDAEAL